MYWCISGVACCPYSLRWKKKKINKKNPISYKTHELFSNSFVQCSFYGICIGSQGYTLIHFWAIQTLKLSGFSPNTGTSTHSTLLYLHVRSLKYFSWNQWFHAQRQQKDISSFREFTSGKKAKCRGGTRKKSASKFNDVLAQLYYLQGLLLMAWGEHLLN